jgi:hypothetical protein
MKGIERSHVISSRDRPHHNIYMRSCLSLDRYSIEYLYSFTLLFNKKRIVGTIKWSLISPVIKSPRSLLSPDGLGISSTQFALTLFSGCNNATSRIQQPIARRTPRSRPIMALARDCEYSRLRLGTSFSDVGRYVDAPVVNWWPIQHITFTHIVPR